MREIYMRELVELDVEYIVYRYCGQGNRRVGVMTESSRTKIDVED